MIEISDFQFRWLCQLRLGSRDCLGVAILSQLKFIERIYKGNYINVLCERAQWGFWYMSTDFICQLLGMSQVKSPLPLDLSFRVFLCFAQVSLLQVY